MEDGFSAKYMQLKYIYAMQGLNILNKKMCKVLINVVTVDLYCLSQIVCFFCPTSDGHVITCRITFYELSNFVPLPGYS